METVLYIYLVYVAIMVVVGVFCFLVYLWVFIWGLEIIQTLILTVILGVIASIVSFQIWSRIGISPEWTVILSLLPAAILIVFLVIAAPSIILRDFRRTFGYCPHCGERLSYHNRGDFLDPYCPRCKIVWWGGFHSGNPPENCANSIGFDCYGPDGTIRYRGWDDDDD